jgi:hypothetical protein
VDAQDDLRAGLADREERRERDDDVVAHAGDIDDQSRRRFFEERSVQAGDHGGMLSAGRYMLEARPVGIDAFGIQHLTGR